MDSTLKVDDSSKNTVLELSGDLSIQHSTHLKSALQTLLDKADRCRIDISDVSELDVSSLQNFYSAYITAKRDQKELHFFGKRPPKFNETLKEAGFGHVDWMHFKD